MNRGTSMRMPGRRKRAVTVTVAEHGGGDGTKTLDESTVELLIDCERRGTRVVLWLTELDDLDTPLAGLATHLATDDDALHRAAVDRVGAERALRAADEAEARRRAAAETLPPGDRGPATRGVRAVRRVRRTGRRIVRRVAARMPGRADRVGS